MGFEKCIKNILTKIKEKKAEGMLILNNNNNNNNNTNQRRQNVLASATLNKDVDRLV
jgi:superfamily II DNA/RNA helicase